MEHYVNFIGRNPADNTPVSSYNGLLCLEGGATRESLDLRGEAQMFANLRAQKEQ